MSMDFSRGQKAELLPCLVEKSAIVHNWYGGARTKHQKAIIGRIFSTKDTSPSRASSHRGLWCRGKSRIQPQIHVEASLLAKAVVAAKKNPSLNCFG
jgi:hypothetical protein